MINPEKVKLWFGLAAIALLLGYGIALAIMIIKLGNKWGWG